MFGDYSSPVADIFRKHDIEFHLYADDTQVYISFPPDQESIAMHKLEQCLSEVRAWMAKNYLKLNDEKTDFIVIGSKHNLSKVETSHVTIGNSSIPKSDFVKNIGAYLDKEMTEEKQVSSTCKSAWYSLYELSKIKKFLTTEQLKSVVLAYVISKLDLNNALLAGSTKQLTSKLQSVQNAAAKMICGYNRYDRIQAPLQELHWLPIEYRIKFKVLMICYKCMFGKGPEYLKELLVPYKPARSLRSSNANLLTVPRTSMKTYGDRSFSVVAPVLWNTLPDCIKSSQTLYSFKKSLKTHFFKQAFDV